MAEGSELRASVVATTAFVCNSLATLVLAVAVAVLFGSLFTHGWDVLPAFALSGILAVVPAYGIYRLWQAAADFGSARYGPLLVGCTLFFIFVASDASGIRNIWRTGAWHSDSFFSIVLGLLMTGWVAFSGIRSARRDGSTNSARRPVHNR